VTLTVIPVPGIGEVEPGDELADLIAAAARATQPPRADGDRVVVPPKEASKVEGRLVAPDDDDAAARRA
jgi:coenzyme F420-0:L-glutamate ligase/coenzyme F420-1:gamma-L-glutamate ligase